MVRAEVKAYSLLPSEAVHVNKIEYEEGRNAKEAMAKNLEYICEHNLPIMVSELPG